MDKIEEQILKIFKEWEKTQGVSLDNHPDDETFACFLENKLNHKQESLFKEHISRCGHCADILASQYKLIPADEDISLNLVNRVKDLIKRELNESGLEIILRIKDKAWELIKLGGDVLIGQELCPAAVLRSRNIREIQDQVIILKDFKDIRVEIRIESKAKGFFDFSVVIKDKQTQRLIKDLRISLIKDTIELESYLLDSGKVVFEHVLLGKYTVEIINKNDKVASIILDINSEMK